jgi:hypothetical protein
VNFGSLGLFRTYAHLFGCCNGFPERRGAVVAKRVLVSRSGPDNRVQRINAVITTQLDTSF